MKETFKYLDSFGTKYSFYTDGKPRLYTTLGGILTIISYLLSLIIFFVFSSDDFRRLTPTTLFSSTLSEDYRKVKFKNEKIWIPWRIVDYNNNDIIDHTGLIYPIIYYYEGVKKTFNDSFVLHERIISYKLCNETSMKDKPDTYYLDIPLNKLYCIDMDDLDMGGSWISLYINYVEIDFYFCENGINYDENNKNCTKNEKIWGRIGKNNSLQIEFYYPEVQFQPTDKNSPMVVLYKQSFYHLSRFSNKIERLFLQEHVLLDDYGWLYKKTKNSSYWGYSSLTGDFYTNTKEKDLVNEGSTSRAYSLNIYLEPSVTSYSRTYKKLQLIFTQSLPIVYIVFLLLGKIAKIFKTAEQKRKTVELLFENLKEKKSKLQKSLYNKSVFLKNRKSNQISENEVRSKGDISPQINNLLINNNGKNQINNNINSHEYLNCRNLNILQSYSNMNSSKIVQKNENPGNASMNLSLDNFQNIENIAQEKKFVKGELFPYKYYFYSVFIKSLDIAKHQCCFSRKFIKVYTFINQMFDVSSYLLLLRDFELVKNKFLKDDGINLNRGNKKINVNSRVFVRNMNECIDNKKFDIFAKDI